MSKLPPILQRKLREYRFAWWCIAGAETACLGTLLIALVHPNWSPLALLWLGWRFLTRPTNHDIAGRLAQHHPDCGETITAAVDFDASDDPAAIQGSPELLQNLYREADRIVAPLPISPLLSLKPVVILMAMTIAINLTLAVRRQRTLATTRATARQTAVQTSRAQPRPAAGPRPPGGESGAGPATSRVVAADWLAQLKQLAAKLDAEAGEVKRGLPPYARSLQSSVDSAEQAVRAGAGGDPAQARALAQTVAEQLAEFARLARQHPSLAAYAASADQLATEFAATAEPQPGPLAGQSPTGQSTTNTPAPPSTWTVAMLPPVPTGARWVPNVAVVLEFPVENIPPGYQTAIREYYEQIARTVR